MNNKILNTLIIAFLVATISCNFATMDRLESLKVNNNIGSSLVESIQLQMQSGGSVDEIVRLLKGLINDLEEQQERHDSEHKTKNTEWNNQLKEYAATIKSLKAKIASLHKSIESTEKQIQSTKKSIRVNNAQIKLVQEKVKALDQARQDDIEATKKRHARQTEMLKAVRYLITELTKTLQESSFIQYDQIKAVLGKIVKENPIEALVQLTMTFNPQSVKFALTKLQLIEESLAQSLEDEKLQTAQAILNYDKLRGELKDVEKEAQKILAANQELLSKQQGVLAGLKQDLKENKEAKLSTEKLKSDLEKKQKAYNETYEANKKQRTAEEKTIQQVIGILENHKEATNNAEANANASAKSSEGKTA